MHVASVAAGATNYYHVDALAATPQTPYATWATASADIQTVLDYAATAATPGDEAVVLVTNGIYSLTSQLVITNDITLRSVNGPEVTAINGGYPASTNRCMLITNCSAVVNGFTMSNGVAQGEAPHNYGGGVYLGAGRDGNGAEIINCHIVNNQALKSSSGLQGRGCGIYMTDGVVSNTVVNKNSSDYGYGGVFLAGGGLVVDCSVTTNNLATGSTTQGGGVYFDKGGEVVNCLIERNTSRHAGGVYMSSGGVLRDSVIRDNMAGNGKGVFMSYGGTLINCVVEFNTNGYMTGSGGGIYIDRAGALVDGCVVRYNGAGNYGGIYCDRSIVRNTLIYGNAAMSGNAGGLHATAFVNTIVENTTIVRNYAEKECGGLSIATANGLIYGPPIRNMIVVGNEAGGITNNVGLAPYGNNDIANNDSFTYSCSDPAIPGVGNIGVEPLFIAAGMGVGLSAAGGDYHLANNSPCIGSGMNDISVGSIHDLDGNIRVRPYGGMVDMGCYEGPGIDDLSCQFIVAPTVGTGPLSVNFEGFADGLDVVGAAYRWLFDDGAVSEWSGAPTISHSFAARVAPYSPTLQVTNAAGDSAGFTLTGGVAVYPQRAYVAPHGGNVAPYDNWAQAAHAIQDAIDVAGGGHTLEIVVSNGVYASGSEIVVNKGVPLRSLNGAAVTILKGSKPLVHRVIRFTTAAGGSGLNGFTVTNGQFSGGEGAGIFIDQMTGKGVAIEDCLIIDNYNPDRSGGGMAMNSAPSVVRNCRFINNVQGGGSYRGGGISMKRGTIVDCLFSNNTAVGSYGGGISASEYSSRIENCIVVNNKATRGGGIYNETATILNTLIGGNEAVTMGGGIYATSKNAKFESCTVVGNQGGEVGGIYQAGGTVLNTIVAHNYLAGGEVGDIGGTVTNYSYSCALGLTEGADGNVSGDPAFVKRGRGAGLTWQRGDYRLWRDSPAAGKGLYVSWMDVALDLAGEARLQGTQPNMGAYEARLNRPGTVLVIR